MVRFKLGIRPEPGRTWTGFNSTMVRFKQVLYPTQRTWVLCFNSTMVRFKRGLFPCSANCVIVFQFHDGSIQATKHAPIKAVPVSVSIPRWFDSSSTILITLFLIIPRFNSTMVRFKPGLDVEAQARIWLFQFHDGSIQAVGLRTDMQAKERFQFHDGSIQATGMMRVEVVGCKVSIPRWFDSS